MKSEDLKKYDKLFKSGDISKARRMLSLIDQCLELTGDGDVFNNVDGQVVGAISNPLMTARCAVTNLLSQLGDTAGITTSAPEQSIRWGRR